MAIETKTGVRLYLKEWMDIRGLSIAQLMARAPGLSDVTIARLGHDPKTEWNSRHLALLAEALAVEPIDLLKPPPR